MITIAKDVLQAGIPHYFDLVEQQGEEVLVTDNGIPVLKIIPIRSSEAAAEAFGDARGKFTYSEDLTLPTEDQWPDR